MKIINKQYAFTDHTLFSEPFGVEIQAETIMKSFDYLIMRRKEYKVLHKDLDFVLRFLKGANIGNASFTTKIIPVKGTSDLVVERLIVRVYEKDFSELDEVISYLDTKQV